VLARTPGQRHTFTPAGGSVSPLPAESLRIPPCDRAGTPGRPGGRVGTYRRGSAPRRREEVAGQWRPAGPWCGEPPSTWNLAQTSKRILAHQLL